MFRAWEEVGSGSQDGEGSWYREAAQSTVFCLARNLPVSHAADQPDVISTSVMKLPNLKFFHVFFK